MTAKNNAYSYLPNDKPEPAAKRKATKGLLEMANMRLRVHRIDADESFDPIESVGFSTVANGNVPYRGDIELTECLGFACPFTSQYCDNCKFGGMKTVYPTFFYNSLALAAISAVKPKSPYKPLFQYGYDDDYDQYDLYLAAPMARGARALAEMRVSGRMNIF